MQQTLSGYKQCGSWADIVEHGERITVALRHLDADPELLEQWDTWRPKSEERLRSEVKDKTAAQAAVSEGPGEKDGKPANRDLKKAGQKLSHTGMSDTPGEAAKDVQQSLSYAARAVDTVSRKAIRSVEQTVYKHVMTKMSPYYFDNELLSANAARTTKLTNRTPEFMLEVNINDDRLLDKLSDVLEKLDSIDRWHGDCPKDITTAVDAEGQDIADDSPMERIDQLLAD